MSLDIDFINPVVHICSKRKGGTKPLNGFPIVDVDRSNEILGNPYVLQDPNNEEEREVVISLFEMLYEEDFKNRGPMFEETLKLSEISRKHGGISLRCWCAPKKCHAELIRHKILQFNNI